MPSPTLVEHTFSTEVATANSSEFDDAVDAAMSGYYGLEISRAEFVQIVQQPERSNKMSRLFRPQLEKAVAEFRRRMEAAKH